MQQQMNLRQSTNELMSMKFDGMIEQAILKHWRKHEPKRVEELLFKGILKKALAQKADALLDMQMALQQQEKLDPALAKLEAWNRLMRPEGDAIEEAKAWGMTVEEYLNRP